MHRVKTGLRSASHPLHDSKPIFFHMQQIDILLSFGISFFVYICMLTYTTRCFIYLQHFNALCSVHKLIIFSPPIKAPWSARHQ